MKKINRQHEPSIRESGTRCSGRVSVPCFVHDTHHVELVNKSKWEEDKPSGEDTDNRRHFE